MDGHNFECIHCTAKNTCAFKVNHGVRVNTFRSYIISGGDVVKSFLHSLMLKLKANYTTGCFLRSVRSENCMRCGHFAITFFFRIVRIVVRNCIHKTLGIHFVLEHSTFVPRFINCPCVVITELSALIPKKTD